MKIQNITIEKSRTFGIEVNGRQKYQKISVTMSGTTDGEDNKEYSLLSDFIDSCLLKEIERIKKQYDNGK